MYSWYDTVLEITAFAAVSAVAYPAARELERRMAIRERLNAGGPAVVARPVLRDERVRSGFLNWVQARTSLNNPVERQRLRAELALAGFENPAAPVMYVALRYALAVALPFFLLVGLALADRPASGMTNLVMPLMLCLLGLMLPGILLRRRIASRRATIEQQFPDALDLMVICIDAGCSLESGILRVSQEMRRSHPQIAREFERVCEELNAGRSRADALHDLARRLEVPAIRGFASLLVQSQTLGASIAQGLKTYAVEMRNTRAMVAEEKAMRIPVLISIPLVVCFLPVIVQAVMLPAIIDIIRVVGPSLRGDYQ
jgi:tight adherence protein C